MFFFFKAVRASHVHREVLEMELKGVAWQLQTCSQSYLILPVGAGAVAVSSDLLGMNWINYPLYFCNSVRHICGLSQKNKEQKALPYEATD